MTSLHFPALLQLSLAVSIQQGDAPPISVVSSEVALAACCVHCGAQPVIADDRCRPCWQYRYRNHCERPSKLIKRAAERHEHRRVGDPSSSILVAEDIDCALTIAEWQVQNVPSPECSEPGCRKTPYDDDGRCKPCHDLAWYRSLAVVA